MEKIKTGTPDIAAENVEKLLELFPEAATEVEGPDGEPERTVDYDVLRGLLGGDPAEGQRERYQFTWPGKSEARAEALRPISKTLRPVKERSKDWDTTQNLYIEGDNLDALKILRETYAGKVKLIYIDPPYNTGHDFVYRDSWARDRDEEARAAGEVDDEGNRLVENHETKGRFHSDWCSMMYPRLMLARDLLTDDGVIAISIDDNEQENLRKLCDEIFGAKAFVAQAVWQKRTSPDARRVISSGHEYVLFYAMQPAGDNCFVQIPLSETDFGRYSNPDNDPNGAWASTDCTAQAGHGTPAQFYDLVTPSGRVVKLHSGVCWRYTKEKMQQEIDAGHIWFGKDGNGVPRKKTYLKDIQGKNVWTWWPNSEVGHTQEATKELKALFDNKTVFDFPKPVRLMKRILEMSTSQDSLVMDFFSGSAPMADAVMQLNAEDGGHRRFIMVQIPEECAEGSEAAKAGYKTICDVGEERIRRAGEKIRAEVEERNAQLELGQEPRKVPDVGFRVLRVDSTNFRDVSAAPGETSQASLFEAADNVKEGRTGLDLLFEALPAFRVPYSYRIREEEIGGRLCYVVGAPGAGPGGPGADYLIACFDEDVGTGTIEAIAKRRPVYAVMRDLSLSSDDAQSNFEELFRTWSPDTVRRVI